MAQFVRDRVGEHDAVVLIHAARLLRLAHAAHIGQSQGPARGTQLVLARYVRYQRDVALYHSHAVVATDVLARY